MLAILASAFLPVAIFLIVIYRKDSEREPPGLLLKCFFLGCVATAPIVFIELFVDRFNVFESAVLRSFYDAFVVAALVEEGMKFLFLFLIVWKRKEFDQHFDGIVYAVFVSLGFAFIENILYVAEGGFGVAILRAVLSVPGHGLFGVTMGYFLSLAKFSATKGARNGMLLLSLLVPILFHGLYNFMLMYLGESENGGMILLLFVGFIVVMIVLWRIAIKYIRKHYTKDRESIVDRNRPYYN